MHYSFYNSKIDSFLRLDGYTPVIFFDYVAKLCDDNKLLNQFYEPFRKTVIWGVATKSYYSMSKNQVFLNAYSGITISGLSLASA